MALTAIQSAVCKLISAYRIDNGCAYIAGGTALNTLLDSPRISRDIDVFHDTADAVYTSWDNDRQFLIKNGYQVEIIRERPGYIEAVIRKNADSVLIEWTQDSAFRFFPLIEHEELGLTLHPFDAATNKILALAGRLEVRDWIDTITCHNKLQKIGYLIWAACGKDPGFNPSSLLATARRSSRYTQIEIDSLVFDNEPPDAHTLNGQWHAALDEAETIIEYLPPDKAGYCVLNNTKELCNVNADELKNIAPLSELLFHKGTLFGAFPVIK